MANPERPLSPHLQVYRPQWTSVLSISHRATGIALAIGGIALAWWLVAVASGPEAYETFVWYAGSFIGRLALFVWTFCLFYHLCNGIRHLVWDTGGWLGLEEAYKSGVVVVVAAVVLTVVSWIAAFAAR